MKINLAAGCLAMLIVVVVPLARAQQRSHTGEVRVPGTDVMLKRDWQLLTWDRCHVAVPFSWQAEPLEAFAHAPDGSSVSMQTLTVESWSSHKAGVRRAYGSASRIHEDSDRRLWLEATVADRTEHYVAVRAGSTVCAGSIDLRRGADDSDLVRSIADSIGGS